MTNMDRATRASDRLLMERLIGALPDPVLMIDDTDRIIAVNDPARALFPHLRPDDFLARSLRSPDVLDLVARVRMRGGPERTTWIERVPVERMFEINCATAKIGTTQLLVLALRDLSEARRLERMRVDFVANASHELRTPLASLLGFVETLQGPARDDAGARGKFLSIMRDQARRMTRLVDDLLSLSRIEQHLHLRPATPIDLTGLVRHIADTLAPLADENKTTIRISAPDPIVVVGDRDELLRVIENLVENAIKYGSSDGRPNDVEIDVDLQGAFGRIRIRDHGPGIAPEHLPRLTERFYRVDVGASREKGGTGLGLAIVKHILARHHGRLTIASELGEGATFTVTVPLHAAA
jgi:two-component system phosphate regulon sensor histidine kinase PhoR